MRPARLLLAALAALVASLGLLFLSTERGDARRGPAAPVATSSATPPRLIASDLDATASAPASLADGAARAPVAAAAPGSDPGDRRPRVHGVVLGSDQAPLAEVLVRAFEPHGRLSRRALLAETSTDEHGRFRFEGADRELLLVCQGEGLVPRWVRARPDEHLEVELRYAVPLFGRVLDAGTRAPLPGVAVRLGTRHFDATRGELRTTLADVTDEEGRWRLPYAEAGGTARLVVEGLDLVPTTRVVQVHTDSEEEVVLLLGAGERLWLRVVDLTSGAPAPGATVRVDGEAALVADDRGEVVATEDLQGAERQRGLTASLPGGPTTERRLGPVQRRATPPPSLPVLVGCRVTGRVLDQRGEPVEGALVRLAGKRTPARLGDPALRRGSEFRDARGSTRTGADGTFDLGGLVPRAEPPHLRVTHADFEAASTEPFVLDRDGLTLEREVRVARGGRVEGLVTLDGEPLSTVVRWAGEGGAGSDTSNDYGAFALTGLPAGTLEVFAELGGRVGRRTRRSEAYVVELAAGETRRLDLALAGDRATLAGTVATHAGSGLGGLRVEARGTTAAGERVQFRGETDADGTFALDVLAEAGIRYRVDATYGSERAWLEDVLPDTTGLELRFAEQGSLLLSVRDATTGALVEGLEVSYRASGRVGEQRGWRGVARRGRSLVHGAGEDLELRLPMGRVDLLVGARSRGYPLVEVLGLEVLREPRGSHPVLLVRGTRLELVFTDAQDRPRRPRTPRRRSWKVQWRPEEGTPEAAFPGWARERTLSIDRRGRAVLPGVPAGRWRVQPPQGVSGKAVRPRTFVVEPTDRQTVRIRVDEARKR